MEQKILSTFLYNHKLKFSEIEKLIKTRSNKLSYYLKKLEKEGVLVKEKDFYRLSETAEHLIPYLSKKKHVLPVVLIHIGDSRSVFLYKREKRPFKGRLSLPGGRLLFKENIKVAVKRIMKEKHNISATLKQIHSVSIEHIKNKSKVIQTDLVIFVTAVTKDKLKLTNLEKNKKKMILSDYNFVKNDLGKKVDVNVLNTRD